MVEAAHVADFNEISRVERRLAPRVVALLCEQRAVNLAAAVHFDRVRVQRAHEAGGLVAGGSELNVLTGHNHQRPAGGIVELRKNREMK